MRAVVVQDLLGNADLVIGTPEYNKARYPASPHGGSPVWLTKMRNQKESKRKLIGKKPYSRLPDGRIRTRRYQEIDDDIWGCFAESLHLKTKSFEYIPKTGKIYLYGQEAATLNRQNGIFSFTLKNINTEKSRFLLRKLDIKLTHSKGKTYWNIQFGRNLLVNIIHRHGGLEGFRYHYRNIFKSMFVADYDSDSNLSTLKLELRDDLYYQCGFGKENMNAWMGANTLDVYCETDIFGVYESDKPLVDVKQYKLELEEDKGSFVKPSVTIVPNWTVIE